MNTHRYLRAYLAGIFLPTLILPVFLVMFIVVRLGLQMPFPIERGLVFPMALVPALWGIWNMLWVVSQPRIHQPIGMHGAVLSPAAGRRAGRPLPRHSRLGHSGSHVVSNSLCSLCTDRTMLAGGFGGVLPDLEIPDGVYESHARDCMREGLLLAASHSHVFGD